MYAAVAELADALDSKSSGAIRAGSSPASGIRKSSLAFGRRAFLQGVHLRDAHMNCLLFCYHRVSVLVEQRSQT